MGNCFHANNHGCDEISTGQTQWKQFYSEICSVRSWDWRDEINNNNKKTLKCMWNFDDEECISVVLDQLSATKKSNLKCICRMAYFIIWICRFFSLKNIELWTEKSARSLEAVAMVLRNLIRLRNTVIWNIIPLSQLFPSSNSETDFFHKHTKKKSKNWRWDSNKIQNRKILSV